MVQRGGGLDGIHHRCEVSGEEGLFELLLCVLGGVMVPTIGVSEAVGLDLLLCVLG